ncbi:hypothetical protein JCM19233_6422 [Vibrio astriarenae]|nr:hypothetical protein JCM19233_6422 [Vibrio sp. C7]
MQKYNLSQGTRVLPSEGQPTPNKPCDKSLLICSAYPAKQNADGHCNV